MRKLPSLFWDVRPLVVALLALAVAASVGAQTPDDRRAELGALVRRMTDYPKVTPPFGGGERLFYFENAGLENQPALYVQDRRELPPRVFIDPNAFSRDGLLAIVDQAASPDGRSLAYAISTQGSSWRGVRIRDARTGQDFAEELHGIRDSTIAWTRDNRGFFYLRVDSARADSHQRVFYHRVGRQQTDDQLIYENREHPDWTLQIRVSEDGQYLAIALRPRGDARNRLYFIDLDNPKRPNLSAPIVRLFDAGDALYEFVASAGPLFFIRTTRDAPRARVVAVDINASDENSWTPIVRESYDPLVQAIRVDDRIIAHRIHEDRSVLEVYALDGAARGSVHLPQNAGTVTSLTGRSSAREAYFGFTTVLQPPTIYRFDLDSRATTVFRQTTPDSALADFETMRVLYTTKDGTKVAMYVTAKRGIALNGLHAALLTADSDAAHPATPRYSPLVAAWLAQGGVYAIANVRNQDDVVAAVDFLVRQRYARASSIGLIARGDGARFASSIVARHPDLFTAVAIDAGQLDAPHLQRAKYPALLLTVGGNDDIAPPSMSQRFATAIQSVQTAPTPVIVHVEPDVGHGSGMPVAKRIEIDTDRLVFLANALLLRP